MFQSILNTLLNYSAAMHCQKVNVKEGQIMLQQTFYESFDPSFEQDLGDMKINVESAIKIKTTLPKSRIDYLFKEKNSLTLNIGNDPVFFYIKKSYKIKRVLGENVAQNDNKHIVEFVRFRLTHAKLSIFLSQGCFRVVDLKTDDNTKIEFETDKNCYVPLNDRNAIANKDIYIVDPRQILTHNIFGEKQIRTVDDCGRLFDDFFVYFNDYRISQI